MDAKHLVDSIYDKLVLRDLIGKVVPGSISMLSVAEGLYGPGDLNKLLAELHWSLILISGGFAWLIGFALQYTGEFLGLLRTHPGGRQSNRTEFFSKWAEFHSTASDYQKLHAERLNVIKEACGNGAVALSAGAVIIVIAQLLRGVSTPMPTRILLTLGILVGVALWRMHLVHVERYGALVANTLGLANKNQASVGKFVTDNPALNRPDTAPSRGPAG